MAGEPDVQQQQPVDRDAKYKNATLSVDISNGPMDDRSCTDILFCLIFVAFVAGMVVVAILAYTQGNPNLLIYPYDEDMRSCGYNLTDYPYLYFYNATTAFLAGNTNFTGQGFCVSQCPTSWNQQINCTPTSNSKTCSVSFVNQYLSSPFLGRFCLPNTTLYGLASGSSNNATVNSTMTAQQNITNLFQNSYISTDKLVTWLGDLVTAKQILFASIGFSFVITMVYLILIRLIGGVLVYLTILLILACFAGLGYVFQMRIYYYEKVVVDNTYQIAMTVLCVFFYVLAAIWLLYVLFMCNAIRLALALLKLTARFLGSVCTVVLVPIFIFVITVAFYIYWVSVSVFLYSSGSLSKGSTFIANFTWTGTIRYSWWYHLFGLFWINAFLNALSQFIIASAACFWYFEQKSDPDKTHAPVATSVYRAFRYHLGSLAFGSLIIAIIQFMIAVLEYIKQKVGDSAGEKVKLIKCLIECCQCCLDCCARFVEFINRHAYIQIALTGESFCSAAASGFGVIVRNLGRSSALMLIGGIFMFLGKLFIASITGLIGYLLITQIDSINKNLNSPILPTVVMILLGWVVGTIFMAVYGMAQDAFLHCFLCDEDSHQKVAQHAPDELVGFFKEERS